MACIIFGVNLILHMVFHSITWLDIALLAVIIPTTTLTAYWILECATLTPEQR